MLVPRLFWLAVLLSAFTSFAQRTTVHISFGEAQEPVRMTPVVLADSTLVTVISTVTDSRGDLLLPDSLFRGKTTFNGQLSVSGFDPVQIHLIVHAENPVRVTAQAATIGEVVITGQLSERSRDDAVQKVRVIDRSVIDAKGAVNLRDVLQTELNIRVSQDQVLGSGMSLQGMGGQNVKILIDGVPVTGRVDGETDLSQINLADVERIEIVEGPSSVSYGSNALAGTINLITKKREKTGHNLHLNTLVESVGGYTTDGRYAVSIRRSQLQFTGMRNYFDGWIDGDPFYEYPQSRIADSGRYKTWKPKLQYQGGVKWIIPVKRTVLTPYVNQFYEHIINRGLPRAPYFNTAFDDHYFTKRTNAGTLIDARFRNGFRLNGVAAFNDYRRVKNTYFKQLNTLDQELTTLDGDQDTTRFYALMSRLSLVRFQADSLLNYEIGYDVNSETGSGQRIENGVQTITEAALFGHTEWTWRRLVLKPGARYTWNSAYKSSFTPAFNLKYTRGQWTVRAGVASGFRSPSIKELYIDFVDINHNIQGNPDLRPEQSVHYQLGIVHRRLVRKHPLSTELNLYYQQVTGKITLAQYGSGSEYAYFNLDHFTATGAQLTLDYAPGRHRFRLGFAETGTKSNLTINGFAFSPEFTASASLVWQKTGITFTPFYKYTGRVVMFMLAETGEPQQAFMNDYHLLDVSASRTCWKKRLLVAVGGRNLLDVTNIAAGNVSGAHTGGTASTPIAWGRSVYVRLQFNIQFQKP